MAGEVKHSTEVKQAGRGRKPPTEAQGNGRNHAPQPLARLLRCATALRVTAPLGYGSDGWYGRKVLFGFAPNMNPPRLLESSEEGIRQIGAILHAKTVSANRRKTGRFRDR